MRIGIDMLGVQSPGSRGRGIGRLSHHLVAHLLALDPSVEFHLYGHEGLPTDAFPSAANAEWNVLEAHTDAERHDLAAVVERLARDNPHRLDVLLTLSPFELFNGYGPPHKPLSGLKMAAVVHDLIPFHYQEQFLTSEYHSLRLYRHLERLRQYDVLLANSDATHADFRKMLGLPAGRVATIGAACEFETFAAPIPFPLPIEARRALNGLGVTGPFVYCLTSNDFHKNLPGLIEAFGLLPAPIRLEHQLVVTCGLDSDDANRIRAHAAECGVGDRLVLTGKLPDTMLRVLYQRCALFAFPSIYEGFGLPLLEAMHCGAPIVAGKNSSQIEVVGDGGLLANVHDPADLAEKLTTVLSDPQLARALGERAKAQASTYSWKRTAERVMEAFNRLVVRSPARRLRVDRAHAPKPRLALFSPFPPKPSGISHYSARLLDELKSAYTIDLYHDAGYVPDLGIASHEFGCFDYRLFDRNAAVHDYRAVLYQMGNSIYHRFIYETALRHPGIVTLHDFCLSGFQWWYSHLHGISPGHFRREVEHFCPSLAREIVPILHELASEPGGMQDACAKRDLYLNRRLFDHSKAVIVHSPWCVRQVRRWFPEHEERTVVVPYGAKPSARSRAEREDVRRRYDLPLDALLFASVGVLTKGKMVVEAIEAFRPIARSNPSALFIVVGPDIEGGEARDHALSLGLEDQVRFLGRPPDVDFPELAAAADIGICLRRPPTYGETSAALLDLLRMGVASIITDVATFSDYPDSVVRKVRWDAGGPEALKRAMWDLANDPRARAELGQSALRYVRQNHGWARTGGGYIDVIDRFGAERGGSSIGIASMGRRRACNGPRRAG